MTAAEGNATDVQVVEIADGIWHARAKHVGWVLVSEGDEVTLYVFVAKNGAPVGNLQRLTFADGKELTTR